MMSSKKDGRLTAHFRQQTKPSTTGPKTRLGKRQRAQEDDKPDPEVLSRSIGEGAVSRADLTEDEQKLRKFDLQTKFGPCAGLTRLERWERAQKFGLAPPEEVRDIILALGGPGSPADRSLWHQRI
ncbi:hypothetical protein Agub_g12027 [Astrephomene gubernaculifera]|uniref:DNA polymerase delta subunit 4 n=1 Tax=Astrephomene gubernaculifera TaxID=47775 RepID=A0AAD3DXM0_9CHLO|nr:hypothetical protein Agub_g12027 [Astrephomene gubernaculifera]